MTEEEIYKNIKTKREAIIISREQGMVEVKYIQTGSQHWYWIKDFVNLFTKIK